MTYEQKKDALSNALANISDALVAVGLGSVVIGKLAQHLLKYKNREIKRGKL